MTAPGCEVIQPEEEDADTLEDNLLLAAISVGVVHAQLERNLDDDDQHYYQELLERAEDVRHSLEQRVTANQRSWWQRLFG